MATKTDPQRKIYHSVYYALKQKELNKRAKDRYRTRNEELKKRSQGEVSTKNSTSLNLQINKHIMNNPEILLGAMCPSIASQLKKQKISFDADEVRKFQKISDATSMLRIHGYIPDAVANVARRKLVKAIDKHLHTYQFVAAGKRISISIAQRAARNLVGIL